jgi:F0F1-type ATP synthase membrane subunit b/b'
MSFDSSSNQPDAETLLHRVVEVLNNGKAVPLSTSVLIASKDEVVQLLESAIERLPAELGQARWMIREREDYLARVQREGDEIVDAARARAERMVQKTEIVREAQRSAQHLVDDARSQANRLRHEAEDYCDQKLAAFEAVLDKTMRSVVAGREKLAGPVAPPVEGMGFDFPARGGSVPSPGRLGATRAVPGRVSGTRAAGGSTRDARETRESRDAARDVTRDVARGVSGGAAGGVRSGPVVVTAPPSRGGLFDQDLA